MIVSKDSWHYKVYRWWYQKKYGANRFVYGKPIYDERGFLKDYDPSFFEPNEPQQSNLCPYFRAVFLWSWFSWLFLRGKLGNFRAPIAAYLFLAIEVPRWLGIISFNAKMALYMFEAAVVITVGLVGLGYGLAYLHKNFGIFSFLPRLGRKLEGVGDAFSEGAHLVREYSRANHDRICPEITFTEAA